jgi:uncharacterized protein
MSQPLPLVDQLKSLESLQELDLKIDSLKRDRSTLPSNLKVIDDSLLKLKRTLDLKKNQALEMEKNHRQALAALELNQDRMGRSSSKLEGVQNSQEFQAANKEIDQIKKLTDSLTEQDKRAMGDLEALQKDVISLTAECEKIQSQRDSQATLLNTQEGQFKKDIDSLMAERLQYVNRIESRTVTQYERIRAARAGLGVVPAVGGRCKGCNMIVPPQLHNEIQRCTMIHTCPSCHRLLFVPIASSNHGNVTSAQDG